MNVALPTDVRSTRFSLPLVTPRQATDLLGGRQHPSFAPGFPSRDDLDALSLVHPEASDPTWGPRLVIRLFDGLVCGTIGFFGAPETDDAHPDLAPEVEVGFGLAEPCRGHGVATEALAALLGCTDQLGVRVRACVEPTNTASLKVLGKNHFTELRGRNEDGRLVMGRPLPGTRTVAPTRRTIEPLGGFAPEAPAEPAAEGVPAGEPTREPRGD